MCFIIQLFCVASTIPCNLSDKLKEVTMTPHADTQFKNVYKTCDRVKIKLPSSLSDCSPYSWNRLPDLTTSNPQDVPGKASSKEISLNMPSQFGVYCTQQCNDPNQEYCAAIAGSLMMTVCYCVYIT